MTTRDSSDPFTEQFRAAFEPAARKTIDNAVKPWRTAVFWLTAGYGLVLIAVSVLLAVTR